MRHIALAAALLAPLALGAQQPDLPSRIDKVFARFDRNTPGCAVGVAKDGRTLLTKGYGSANLEYGVPLTDSSVMESGSVAKQFTAAAIVLLQQDGKLSIDDDIRKHLPEVPDFGHKITIRNLLTHTSGLRDQWGLLSVEGRGPGSQVHSSETTLDLVKHQKSLNFAPGSAYMYSNTGFALAGIIIERVSKKSLRDFSQERLFGPLGMTHTQWRDDFTRVVPNRATAYAPVSGGGYRQDMPFTNMIGNGGLLSTMDDLLKWNENLDRTTVGGPTFTPTLETRMRLTNGRLNSYALGLTVDDYDGVREVSHGGSTAGYRTVLARYPDQRVSVAVWCSNASVNAGALGRQVADLVLVKPTPAVKTAPAAIKLTKAEVVQWTGLYRDPVTDQALSLTTNDTALTAGASVLVPLGATRFRLGSNEATFARASGKKTFVLARVAGDSSRFEEIAPAPAKVVPSDYTGRYVSEELDVELNVVMNDGKLMLFRRPEEYMGLTPSYLDGFTSPLGSLRFSRDANGAVSGFAIFSSRALDMRFKRVK